VTPRRYPARAFPPPRLIRAPLLHHNTQPLPLRVPALIVPTTSCRSHRPHPRRPSPPRTMPTCSPTAFSRPVPSYLYPLQLCVPPPCANQILALPPRFSFPFTTSLSSHVPACSSCLLCVFTLLGSGQPLIDYNGSRVCKDCPVDSLGMHSTPRFCLEYPLCPL
jgi:hypothetical protein